MLYPLSINRESTMSNTQRITFFEYLYVFVMLIYAGRANIFVESASFSENPVGVLLPVVLSVILALRWKVAFDSRFFLLIFGLGLYFMAISLKYTMIQPTFFIVYFFIFFIVYVVIRALKYNLFKIYERLVFYLAILGLFFWVVQIVLGGDTLYDLIGRISSREFSYVTGEGLNAVLYSIQPSFTSLLYDFSIPRNCGFAWEPGAFAVYLCFAIFINLFFTSSADKGKYRLWVLVAALVSTQSTTGYLIFVVMILYYLLNKKLNIILLLLPIVIVSLIYLSTLPFMSKKVIELIDETKGVDQLMEDTYGRETSANPQRFTSLMIALVDFRANPILGVGAHKEATWTYKLGANISIISGIGDLLAQFGIVGFLFFIILSVKTSYLFAKHYKYNGKLLLFFIILFLSVSYYIILLPMVMCFWMFQLFVPEGIDDIEEKNPALNSTNKPGNP
jgi:hypothetical protein